MRVAASWSDQLTLEQSSQMASLAIRLDTTARAIEAASAGSLSLGPRLAHVVGDLLKDLRDQVSELNGVADLQRGWGKHLSADSGSRFLAFVDLTKDEERTAFIDSIDSVTFDATTSNLTCTDLNRARVFADTLGKIAEMLLESSHDRTRQRDRALAGI